jgi:hypothetical protein
MMIRFATTLPASQQGPIFLATREFFRFGTPAMTIAIVGSMAWLLGILAAAVALARHQPRRSRLPPVAAVAG